MQYFYSIIKIFNTYFGIYPDRNKKRTNGIVKKMYFKICIRTRNATNQLQKCQFSVKIVYLYTNDGFAVFAKY